MTLRDSLRSLVTFGASPAPATMATAQPIDTYALAANVLGGQLIGRPTWPTWDPQLASREGYNRLALIYRCVNIIAHALGTATIRVYDEARDNEAIPDHAMRQLMRRPNPQMGEASFWSHVGIRAAIAGFCVVEKERNGLGEVIALWPLQSSYLKAIPRRDGSHDWEYRIPGIPEPFRLDSRDVIPFRWADTATGSPYGQGPLETCLREVSLSNTMTDFLKLFFEQGAVPLHGIIPETDAKRLNQTEVDAMLDAFVLRRGGLANASRPIYLQAIKDIKRLGFDFNELAYTDLRDLSELGIVQAFGIPASVAQVRVGLEHSDSRANAEVDEGKLYRQTIIPMWTRFDDALTLKLLPDFEPVTSSISLEFDTSRVEALQENRNDKATWLNQAASGGIISVHTWHREMGIEPPDGDDYFLRPIAVEAVPASEPIPPALPAAQPALAALPPGALRATLRAVGYDQRYARAVSGRARIAKVAKAREPSIDAFLAAQAKRVIPTVMQGLATHAPIAIHANGGAAATVSDSHGHATYALRQVDWADEDRRLKKVAQSLYLLAGAQAFDAIENGYGIPVGISFDLQNPHVSDVVDKLATQVTRVNDQTRGDIAERVTQGLNEGKSLEDIRDSLNGLFEETYRGRALAIARTESMFSYGEASALGFKESGVVDRAQIFDNPDHDEDYGASDGLTCATRDGIIVPLDEAVDHIYADHPNGSAVMAPILTGQVP